MRSTALLWRRRCLVRLSRECNNEAESAMKLRVSCLNTLRTTGAINTGCCFSGFWPLTYSAYPLNVVLHKAHVLSVSHPGAVLLCTS